MECYPIVDLSAEDIQERVLAVAHDAVRDQSLPWRKGVSRREAVEEGHDVERVAETMRVNAERGDDAYCTSSALIKLARD